MQVERGELLDVAVCSIRQEPLKEYSIALLVNKERKEDLATCASDACKINVCMYLIIQLRLIIF